MFRQYCSSVCTDVDVSHMSNYPASRLHGCCNVAQPIASAVQTIQCPLPPYLMPSISVKAPGLNERKCYVGPHVACGRNAYSNGSKGSSNSSSSG